MLHSCTAAYNAGGADSEILLIKHHQLKMKNAAQPSSSITASSYDTDRPCDWCALQPQHMCPGSSTALRCAEHQCKHIWVLDVVGSHAHSLWLLTETWCSVKIAMRCRSQLTIHCCNRLDTHKACDSCGLRVSMALSCAEHQCKHN